MSATPRQYPALGYLDDYTRPSAALSCIAVDCYGVTSAYALPISGDATSAVYAPGDDYAPTRPATRLVWALPGVAAL